jgi:transposase-like protein
VSQPRRIEDVLNSVTKIERPDPEVVAKAKRRTFSVEYELRFLREADACTEPGEIGSLLRREGLYSSHLSNWRRQRQVGTLAGLKPKKRGRKAAPEMRHIAELGRCAALTATSSANADWARARAHYRRAT